MRITNNMVMEQYTRELNSNISSVSEDSEEISAGRSFLNASDNPVSASETLSASTQLNTVKQYQSNITTEQNWMSETDSAVESIQSILTSATTTLDDASSSASNSSTSNATLASDLESDQTELLSTLNTELNGQYIFGGSTDGLPPFKAGTESDYTDYQTGVSDYVTAYNSAIDAGETSDEANADGLTAAKKVSDIAPVATFTYVTDSTQGTVGTISAASDSLTSDDIEGKLLYLTPGTDSYIPVSQITTDSYTTGTNATSLSYYTTQNSAMTRTEPVDLGFGTQMKNGSVEDGTAFESFTDPLDFLLQTETGNGTNNLYDDFGITADKLNDDDTSTASNSLSMVDNMTDSVAVTEADIGGKDDMLSFLSTKYTSDNTNVTSQISSLEDTDVATAYAKYSLDMMVYQASLAISSTILQNNLTNYLSS